MHSNRPPPSSTDDSNSYFWLLDSVIKSPLDFKQYRVIQLQNGLRATLVSTCNHEAVTPDDDYDDTSMESKSAFLQMEIEKFNQTHLGIQSYYKFGDLISTNSVSNIVTRQGSTFGNSTPTKSAKLVQCYYGPATICLTVGAGSYNDPKSTPGLAHFVQRLVLRGSKQHPEPYKLFTKVYNSGGVVTATTATEHTTFCFSCDLSAFAECVHIFVDYLTNPLFKDSDIEDVYRQLEAANLKNKETSEQLRIRAFLRNRAKVNHPFRGDKQLSSVHNFKVSAYAWKQRFYKADYMTVCIHAPVPMETLEGFVFEHFSDIPNAPMKTLSPSAELLSHGQPFSRHEFQTIFRVAPDSQLGCIILSWVLPPEIANNYETKPLEYIRLMLEHTSFGGLKHFLRVNQWISEWNNLYISCPPSNKYCQSAFASFFSISIDLTDKGQTDMSDVIKTVFSYLKLLTEQGIQVIYFEEMKRGAATKFHCHNWDEMIKNGIDVARNMQYVPSAHILTCSDLLTNWDPDAIRACLKLLSPRSANYTFVSKVHTIGYCPKKSDPYEVRCRKVDIQESCYSVLEEIDIFKEFQLPPENTFLVREIVWIAECAQEDISRKLEGLSFTSNVIAVKALNDKKLQYLSPRLPSAHYQIQYSVPQINENVLVNWLRRVDDMVIHRVGHQFDYLFNYELGLDQNRISIDVEGPRCHLLELLDIITNVMNSQW